jgi:acetyl-CoA acetyltransferase family protein
MSSSIVVLAAKRTAVGTFGGTLKGWNANDLGAEAAKAALAQAGLVGDELAFVDQVIVGNVLQTSADAIYCARHVGLKAGLPITVPALTVNRLCGSGFQAIVSGAEQILLGDANVVLVGGTENMSMAPHVIRGGRDGFAYGRAPAMEDMLAAALVDSYVANGSGSGTPMGITAENLAVKYGISREDCDNYALLSQARTAAAKAAGAFKDEIAPLTVSTKKGDIVFAEDEHPRPATTAEQLAKLKPVFKKDGVVTAGNASGINDAGCMLVLAREDWAKEHGKTPIARLRGWGTAAVDPSIMGIGPVPAIKLALARTGLSLADVDLVEVNEAFASQYLAVEKEFGLDREKTNLDGGAIAIGHPLAASGARITAHLCYALAARNKKIAVGSACIGGGQGMAVVLERI